MNSLKNDWHPLLKPEWEKTYYRKLWQFLNEENETQVIYPEKEDIFNALNLTPYRDVKAVILGQDPYHGQGQAHGLSFSVQPGVTPPPSLKNIYKELHQDVGCDIPNDGHLLSWAQQGVLLLNAVLTVRAGQPNSHQGKGWENFTDQVIRLLNDREQPIAFVLWGKYAQKKSQLITSAHHFILQSPHPSPFSANKGFFGSKPFSRINDFLQQAGSTPIDWSFSSKP